MTYRPFPSSLINQITSTAHQISKQRKIPLFAAFDADGTLWDTDVGNLFFHYHMTNPHVKIPQKLWKDYEAFYFHNPKDALTELAFLNAGHSLSQVRKWAKDCYNQNKKNTPILTPQIDLIKTLQDLNVRVYIVTASFKYAVEPFAETFNVDRDHVIGTELEVQDDLITRKLKRLTYGKGKVEGLLQETKGIKPFFSIGNAMPDQPLLRIASHLRLAVQSTKKDIHLYESEQELKNIAIKEGTQNGWLHHQFYND